MGKNLKKIWTEKEVNQQLFFITAVLSVITMAMFLISFFSKGEFPPSSITVLYLGVLVVYAIHKESLRWMKSPQQDLKRKGELFVYIWISFTASLYIIDFLNPGRYNTDSFTNPALQGATILSLEILVIFILTKGSKIVKKFYKK